MTSTALHRRRAGAVTSKPDVVRVALYTRKSTEKGLDSAFNSLDSQRTILEDFVATKAAQDWIVLPQRYDDGGFSGGNTKRPGLQQLLADVKAGLVDAVACYRLDRLSRDTGDFIQLMDFFRSHSVAVVSPNESVEQATASDRLTLGVRVQVSQFEREIAAERIRDKMRAARRQGLWQGGRPVLGYDVIEKRLVVNEAEAELVREVFKTYARLGCLTDTLAELKRRAISNKRWTGKKGQASGGRFFSSISLRNLLGNRLYRGELPVSEGEWAPGDQKTVVPEPLWDRVQGILAKNAADEDRAARTASGSVLQAILRCGECGSAMTPTHARKGPQAYRYYTCFKLKRFGRHACPGSRVSAGDVEAKILDHLRRLAREPSVMQATVDAARAEQAAEVERFTAELRRHEADVRRLHAERARLVEVVATGDSKAVVGRLAEVEQADEHAAQRIAAVQAEIDARATSALDEAALREVLLAFDPVWTELGPAEKARVMALLLHRVTYHGQTGQLDFAFRAGGTRDLLHEME